MSESRLVPKLRFPEFNEEWEMGKIENYVKKVVAGATPKTSIKEYWKNGTIPWMSSGEIHLKNIFDVEKRITQKGYESTSTKLIPINSVLIALAGQGKTRGTVAINKIELCTNQSLASIIPNEKLINYKFLFHILSKKYEDIRKISSGEGGRGGLNLKLVKSIKITIPTIIEQTKIASFLSAVDKKIELLKEKHEQMKQFKKYLMQQIFSQKLRFKDENGNNFDDWQHRKLSEFLFEHKIKSSGKEEVYSVSVHKGLINQIEHLGRSFSSSDTSKYNLVKYGDIVYTKSPTGDFPLGIIKQNRVNKDVIVSPLYGVFTPETFDLGYILNDYFESKINTHNYLHPIVQKGAKNTMNITNKTFLSKTLFVPIDKKEQKIISKILRANNKKINLLELQISQMEEFKKGLLQQMFV